MLINFVRVSFKILNLYREQQRAICSLMLLRKRGKKLLVLVSIHVLQATPSRIFCIPVINYDKGPKQRYKSREEARRYFRRLSTTCPSALDRMAKVFSKMQKAQVDYHSFSCLREDGAVLGPRRFASLHQEVELERLEGRESRLQMRYAELQSRKKVNILEKLIAVLKFTMYHNWQRWSVAH